MIFDILSNLSSYSALGPRFARALEYLGQFDSKSADGRVAIEGDDIFALVQSYTPSPAGTRPFEAHRIYADVQFVAAGSEVIQYSPLGRLRETAAYSASKDVAFFDGSDDFPLFMSPGCFAILLPADGHKPGCLWQRPELVKKVVVKVRL
jgi:biofilm protein TabA